MKAPSPGAVARVGSFCCRLLVSLLPAHAGSATWNLNPTSGDWNKSANWTPATIPNGRTDTATFGVSNTTAVTLSTDTEVAAVIFESGASAYTISTARKLTFGGAGVVNNSGVTQNFVSLIDAGSLRFRHSATAGDAAFTQQGGGGNSTDVEFFDSASAGSATFVNEGGSFSAGGVGFFDTSTAANATFFNQAGTDNGGATVFFDHTTAGNATFICDGGSPATRIQGFVSFYGRSSAQNGTFIANGASTTDASVGNVTFSENSTAGNATLTANGGTVRDALGGRIYFSYINGRSRAGNATLIANGGTNGGLGGTIFLDGDSRGDTARVKVFDDGGLNASVHNAPGVTIGSIEGNGSVIIGSNNLTVGTNDLDTIFAGTIRDGAGSSGGSLTKVGAGTLTLAGANTYTGDTIVSEGTLSARNNSGSATGSGAVQVNAGRLGGNGTITGTVTVGTGTGAGAQLAPGTTPNKPGVLTLVSTLTFNSDGVYRCELNSDIASSDEVFSDGATINNGAEFLVADSGTTTLTPGLVFTVINDTAITPINGTFANLADGSTFTVGVNTFQANYEGGDGNDLTLTVVP